MEMRYLVDLVDRRVASRVDWGKEYPDQEWKHLIHSCMEELDSRLELGPEEKEEIFWKVFNGRCRLGILQPFLEDPSINEIMINGTDYIIVERDGRLIETKERFVSRDKLTHVVQHMVSWANRTVNESHPIVDARLPDGSRIHAVLFPVALNGPVVTIRKFAETVFDLDQLISFGTLTEEERDFLCDAVRSGRSILFAGGTSSGKTTMLDILSGFIPEDQRLVAIEDSAELRLYRPNCVRLETRTANSEGKGSISMRQLIKASLRMRPDRLIIGEVRDASAADLLTALCTGHDGSMATIHANSANDSLIRLETLALWEGHISCETIRRQIVSGIDLVVFLRRDDKMRRKIKEILEVCSYVNGQIVCRSIFRAGVRIVEDPSPCPEQGSGGKR